MNLWATAAQATVSAIVSFTVLQLYKRAARRERERVERLLAAVDAMFGFATSTITLKETKMDTLQQYRKAFAAGFGIILIGLLSWASTDGVLAALLEPIVPDTFKPLIGVLVGGIATVVAVIRTSNAPSPQAVLDAATPAVQPVAARAFVPANTSETSIVPLLPAPEPSYQ